MTFMAFRLSQLVISCKPQPVIEKKRDKWRPGKGSAGTGDKQAKKRDVPAKTGRLATLLKL